MLQKLSNDLHDFYPEMVNIRRDFHMYPELSFEEVRTPKKIAEFLTKLGIDVRTGVGKIGGGNGVVGTLYGGKPGKTIALRADFDGLPIQDEKDVPYKSKIDGVMHACGHDIHTAALLGVAKVLSAVREHIKGNVVFIHQFAEEKGTGGAKPMIADGCLDGVDRIYGAHVWSSLPYGTVGVRKGFAMASYDGFEIEVVGSGGHGAEPHQTIDPIVVGSNLVINLQQITSRRLDPLEPAVVSIGAFNSGNAGGVIPGIAKITGTVRTFNANVRTQIEANIRSISEAICQAAGAKANINYIHGYPSLENDPAEAQKVKKIGKHLVGEENMLSMEQLMSAEDFSYYLQKKRGSFFFVGGKNPDIGATYPHHHAKFDVDERSMLHIGQMFLGLLAKNGLMSHNNFTFAKRKETCSQELVI